MSQLYNYQMNLPNTDEQEYEREQLQQPPTVDRSVVTSELARRMIKEQQRTLNI